MEKPFEKKLRILALHGYRQNSEIFYKQTEQFRKIVEEWAKFMFVTAPHEVLQVDDIQNINPEEACSMKQYGWFFNRDDKTNRGTREGGPAIGFEESMRLIEEIFQKHGPFDGIMGFSQGACLVALLCDLKERGLTKALFHFGVLFSGFKSKCLPHMKYFSEPLVTPTLHIIGDSDNIIPKEMSEELCGCFSECITVEHPGGHIIPTSSKENAKYEEFFRLLYEAKQKCYEMFYG